MLTAHIAGESLRIRFSDEGLRRLYEASDTGNPQFGPDLARSYRKKVGYLTNAASEQDIRAMASLRFEKLSGKRMSQHSIRLNRQWRLILEARDDERGRFLQLIEIVDYH